MVNNKSRRLSKRLKLKKGGSYFQGELSKMFTGTVKSDVSEERKTTLGDLEEIYGGLRNIPLSVFNVDVSKLPQDTAPSSKTADVPVKNPFKNIN